MKLAVKNGVTSLILRVKILDNAVTTGAGKTGLTHSSSGLLISTIADNEATATVYAQASSNTETITTLGTFAAPTASKCRFKEVDATNHPGIYEIHIANARWAVSSARSVIVSVSGVSGAAQVDAEIQLDPVPANVEKFGDTAGTFASGRPEVNTTHAAGTAWASGAITAASIAASALTAAKFDTACLTAAKFDTGCITATTFAAGAIDNAAIATDAISSTELAASAVGEIADAIWDELLSGHAISGSAGEALAAAGTAGDPWTTSLPGAYGAGTAGKILGDNLNATVSSRASQTSVDTIDDFLDTEIAAILADTNELQTDWTNGGRLDLIIDDILVDTGTTLQAELDGIQADTEDIQTRLPAALVSGRIDASVGAMAANVFTASALATDAVNEIVDQVWDESNAAHGIIGSTGEAVGVAFYNTENRLPAALVSGRIDASVGAMASGVLTATAIAADAITAAKVDAGVHQELIELAFTYNATADYAGATAGSLVKEIADNAGGSGLTAGAIADAVWDEALAGHVSAGSTGEALNAAGGAGDPWITAVPGAYGVGSAGYILGTNLNATVSSRASQTSLDTVDDFLDTEIAAIKAKTDNLPTDPADASDVAAAITAATSPLATAANLATVAGYLDTEIAAILADTNELQTDWANGGRLDLIVDTAAADALKAADRSGYVLALAGGAIANPQTATETFVVTTGGNTFTVTGSGITSTGGRGAPTLAKT